jgi:protein ImuB
VRPTRAPHLWLALRPLQLPLQVLAPGPWEQALCVLEKQKVLCANDAATQAGVTLGMDATRARLLCDCQTLAREPQLEQQLLDQLAERLYAFTPYIEFHQAKNQPEAGLLLEISRCLNLFSGVISLSEKIFAAMADIRFAYGLAHSAPAAWLLSYQQHAITGKEEKTLFLQRLNSTGIHLLHDFPGVIDALHKTGFTTLSDIAQQIHKQSITSIKKRFGEAFASYLGAVFGIDQSLQQNALFDQPLNVYQPQEFFFDALQFDYPVNQIDQLSLPLEAMLQKLTAYLCQRQLACQHIEWRLFDIGQNSEPIRIHCDKSQTQWQLLHQLTLIHLEYHQLPFAVDTVELTCRHLQKRQHQNHKLDFHSGGAKPDPHHHLTLLEAKLNARLGAQAVFKISYNDSHIPECSNNKIPSFATSSQELPPSLRHNPRPGWIFDMPIPIGHNSKALRWRGVLQLLTTPERIQSHWWDIPTARDYYIAQRADGLRVWVYKDLAIGEWFAQGVFAG